MEGGGPEVEIQSPEDLLAYVTDLAAQACPGIRIFCALVAYTQLHTLQLSQTSNPAGVRDKFEVGPQNLSRGSARISSIKVWTMTLA